MNRTKKIILLLTCIFLHSQNNLSASTENELENTQDILQKLASINNMDVQNINAVEDSSYSLLFNNFVNFKNFIVNNFSKSKFQKLCKEFIDQIYPEEDTDMIDFGIPVIIPEPVITTTETTTVALDTSSSTPTDVNENQSTDSFSLNDTAPSLDFSTTTTETTQTVTTEVTPPQTETSEVIPTEVVPVEVIPTEVVPVEVIPTEVIPVENLNPGEPE